MGTLVIIGGGEDKRGECRILQEVVRLTKENPGPLLILTTATTRPEKVGNEYRDIFYDLGLDEVEVLHIDSRNKANSIQVKKEVQNAASIFFTGGDQLRLTSLLGGTLLSQTLGQCYGKDTVIIGTSAGAAVMSAVMIVSGESEEPPRKCTLKLAPGLGLLEGVVIDQHFAQRGRLGRLLGAIAQNPAIIGIGIDEDTGILIQKPSSFQVIGSQTVTIVDGRELTYTNVSEQAPEEPLALFDIRIHILPKGSSYHLIKNRPLAGERV